MEMQQSLTLVNEEQNTAADIVEEVFGKKH
jgi:hypothetical protein